jgi:hypothetical protein
MTERTEPYAIATADVALRGRRVDRATASLSLGPRSVLLTQLEAFAVTESLRRDRASSLATILIFAVIALLAVVLVTDLGMRKSLLLTGATFGLIAVSAFDDLARSVCVTIYTLDVVLRGGERVRYATPDLKEVQRMISTLQRAGVARHENL